MRVYSWKAWSGGSAWEGTVSALNPREALRKVIQHMSEKKPAEDLEYGSSSPSADAGIRVSDFVPTIK